MSADPSGPLEQLKEDYRRLVMFRHESGTHNPHLTFATCDWSDCRSARDHLATLDQLSALPHPQQAEPVGWRHTFWFHGQSQAYFYASREQAAAQARMKRGEEYEGHKIEPLFLAAVPLPSAPRQEPT